MARVLIATDGSDDAIAAAAAALAMLAPPDHLGVLCVVDVRSELAVGGTGLLGAEPLAMSLADPATAAELGESLTRDARAAVERTIAALGRTATDTEAIVAHGDPASEICRAAETGDYDLIVVGSHGAGFVKRVLVGTVSGHVVHHAPCPVLVVRQ